MSGRMKIKPKGDKKPKTDVMDIINKRFKNMSELRDLIDMDPRKGAVRIREGGGGRAGEARKDEVSLFPWDYTILTVTR